jgi:hypothetical protein
MPIAPLSEGGMMLVINASSPWKNLKELVEYSKKNPDMITISSSGALGITHLLAEIFANEAAVKWRHIPYQGSGPAITALLGNHVPTIKELGYSVGSPALYGISAPKGTLRRRKSTRSTATASPPTSHCWVQKPGCWGQTSTPLICKARKNCSGTVSKRSNKCCRTGAESPPPAPFWSFFLEGLRYLCSFCTWALGRCLESWPAEILWLPMLANATHCAGHARCLLCEFRGVKTVPKLFFGFYIGFFL